MATVFFSAGAKSWPKRRASCGTIRRSRRDRRGRPTSSSLASRSWFVIARGIRNPGVRQCLGFCSGDFWSSLAYESAEQKPKHCLTPGFLIPLMVMDSWSCFVWACTRIQYLWYRLQICRLCEVIFPFWNFYHAVCCAFPFEAMKMQTPPLIRSKVFRMQTGWIYD